MHERDQSRPGTESERHTQIPEPEAIPPGFRAPSEPLRLQSMSELLERIPCGLLILASPSGRLLADNSEMRRIFAEPWPLQGSIAAFLDQRLDLGDTRHEAGVIQRVLTSGEGVSNVPVRLRGRSGQASDLIFSTAPILESEGMVIAGVVACREDQGPDSERSTALQMPIELLAALISAAAVPLRDAFLAGAAHELRTPLTTISGFSQLIERQLQRPDIDLGQVIHLNRQLRAQIERLVALTDNLMTVTTLRDGLAKARQQPCDLASIARDLVARAPLLPEYRERHEIIFDAPKSVDGFCDPDHADQILTNLVSNALKYSPDGGIVRVVVAPIGSSVELTVSDQGVGIALEDQQRLGQPFTRFGPLRRQVNGAGLGLFVVWQLIERNGGTVDVESAIGVGSTFIIRLPAAGEQAEETAQQTG